MNVLLKLSFLKTHRFCNFLTEIKLLLPKQVNLFGGTFNKRALGHWRTLGNSFNKAIVYGDF